MDINSAAFDNMWLKIVGSFIGKIQPHKGLEFFAANRNKFEGWMKVELCETLANPSNNIKPEKDRIDIVINDNFAIELKTINTNYRTKNVENKIRPITKNIDSVCSDIDKLKKNGKYEIKSVMFIVFPLSLESEKSDWVQHIDKIEQKLTKLESKEFYFSNTIRGKLYFGLI